MYKYAIDPMKKGPKCPSALVFVENTPEGFRETGDLPDMRRGALLLSANQPFDILSAFLSLDSVFALASLAS